MRCIGIDREPYVLNTSASRCHVAVTARHSSCMLVVEGSCSQTKTLPLKQAEPLTLQTPDIHLTATITITNKAYYLTIQTRSQFKTPV